MMKRSPPSLRFLSSFISGIRCRRSEFVRNCRCIRLEPLEPRYALAAPVAVADSIVMDVNTVAVPTFGQVNALDNDTDPDTLHAQLKIVDVSVPMGEGNLNVDLSGDTGNKTIEFLHGKLTVVYLNNHYEHFVFVPNDNITGTVTFTYHISDGIFTSDAATVTINVLPVANPGGDQGPGSYTIYEGGKDKFTGQPLLLDGSLSRGPGLKYSWSINGHPIGTPNSTSPTLPVSWTMLNGIGIVDGQNLSATVALTVLDSNGKTDSFSVPLDVINVDPEATSFSIVPATAGGCGGFDYVLTATIVEPNPLDVLTVSINWNLFGSAPAEPLMLTPSGGTTFTVTAPHLYTPDFKLPQLIISSHNAASGNDEFGSALLANGVVNPAFPGLPPNWINVTDGGPPTAVEIDGAPASSQEGTEIHLTSDVVGGCGSHVYIWSVTKNGAPYASGSAADFSFTPDDNGSYLVSLKVDGVAASPLTVTPDNVPPAATLGNNGAIAEGDSALVSFSNEFDPSSVDVAAGLHYSFALGAGGLATSYATAIDGISKLFSFNDNGSYTVYGRIFDKDGGANDYTTTVTVSNVAPTLTLSGNSDVNEGSSYTLDLSSLDPGADTIDHWTIDWGDSTQIVNGNPPSVTHTYADGSSAYTISATATDEDGTFSAGNTLSVTVNNVAPTLVISGAASVNEGSTYTLNLSSSDPGADTVDHWTIDWGDGALELVSGHPASVTHTYADGPSSYTISATASDEDGTFAAGNTVSATVNNVAPTASISSAPAGVTTQPITFGLTVSDLSPIDQADDFSYAIHWGDGSDITISGSSSDSAVHAFAVVGTYTVTVTATDKDGGTSTIASTVVAISSTLQLPGTLLIGETNLADSLVLRSSDIPAGTQNVIVYAGGGNDNIQISGSVSVSVWLFGGPGNDRLKGGGGNDVIIGGEGDDLLMGGGGRDIIIGGRGADRIIGDADDDILVGGRTVYDANEVALAAILAEWTSTRSYSARVANISNGTIAGAGSPTGNGLNLGYYLIADYTVIDDDASDILTGSSGLDWYLFNTDGENGTHRDTITGLNAAEFAADLDWINTLW
jgi:hypothetical protein